MNTELPIEELTDDDIIVINGGYGVIDALEDFCRTLRRIVDY